MLNLLLPLAALAAAPAAATDAPPAYTIQAIRYASAVNVPTSMLVMGAPKGETVDIAMVVWLIRGGGRNILFDSGFHRPAWFKAFPTVDYLRPDEAVALAGVKPDEVTDVVISHAHWDHMGGIDLFPKAVVWIQKQEFAYYTGDAWQPGGRHGGIDAEDVKALVQLNTEGRLRLVDGDDVEILPGIRAYTGARHVRLAVHPRRGRRARRPRVGQLLSRPQPQGAQGERDVQRSRRGRKREESGPHGRARRIGRARRPGARPESVPAVPGRRPDRADPLIPGAPRYSAQRTRFVSFGWRRSGCEGRTRTE